jgi:hypothetical protein
MASSTILKWAAAAAGVLVIGAVPALAAHTHKHLAATGKSGHALITSSTPLVGSAKAHKLHVASGTPKKLGKTHHRVSKLHARKTKTTASHHRKTSKLDKTKSAPSIM